MFVAFVQLYMENILNYGFLELCIFKHNLVQVSWSHSISTTKMKLVDCTRNYRHVMFYET